MKTINLKKMTIRNFKSIRGLEAEFGPLNEVKGGNGVGKTTIYDAYLWCIFGNTSGTNQTVQTIDETNDVIHKIETSVRLELEVDGVIVTVERRLTEKWKAAGTPEEKFEGTTTLRFYNDVPCSVADFNAKLNAICPLQTWSLLTNVRQFMSMKTEDRRKLLLNICGKIDEETIQKDFPAVSKAMKEGKTLEELTRQMKQTRKRADSELVSIPTKIAAQDKLKVDKDFKGLRRDLSVLDESISDIDKQMQASTDELAEAKAYNESVTLAQTRLDDKRAEKLKAKNKKLEDIFFRIRTLKNQMMSLSDELAIKRKLYKADSDEISKTFAVFENAKEKWGKANNMEFTYDEQSKVCPVCHRPFTEEMKQAEKANAIAEFNKHKSEECAKYIAVAQDAKAKIDELNKRIDEYKAREDMITSEITEIQAKIEPLDKEYDEMGKISIDNDNEVIELANRLAEVSANKPVRRDNSELEEKKRLAVLKRDGVIKELSYEDTNNRIDKQKETLEAYARELAQIISECDNTLYQIKQYKRQHILAMEQSVNAYFSLCKWKFYEKNISNDDEKEICTCVAENGVDYENQNNAMRVNMGIDIIEGLSVALGNRVPLFVDNAESVNHPLLIGSQEILLKVNKEKALSIEQPIY